MDVESFDLVLFPHCDMHLVLSGQLQLTVTVKRREYDGLLGRYNLVEDVTRWCSMHFFAPHAAPPDRLKNLPTVDYNTGKITATTPGVYLFQVTYQEQYIVGRLQVHSSIDNWWFGNDSITAVHDPTPGFKDIAHTQPSIYAQFSDDGVPPLGPGTDLVGDITGHDYVPLTPADASKFVVEPRGRLRGLAETAEPVKLHGNLLGHSEYLNVRVVNYGKIRADLFANQVFDLATANKQHNMLFLAEGFQDTKEDRDHFDEIVANVTRELFGNPRHEPFGLLDYSINVFRAFTSSQQNAVTCGYRVTNKQAGGITAGAPIPPSAAIGKDTNYTLDELVRTVGLPLWGESRDWDALKAHWKKQAPPDFEEDRIEKALVEAWKALQFAGFLQSRDTFFGLHLGSRLADRSSREIPVNGTASPPKADTTTDENLEPFVRQVYEFYATDPARHLTPDPRRHPPELYAVGNTNPSNSVLRYVAGLTWHRDPWTPIGQVWQPDDAKFRPSRGLIAIIAHDGLDGGTSFSSHTLTALTVNEIEVVRFAYQKQTTAPYAAVVMRRDPQIETKFDRIANVTAHEFGHSLNLGDEYEDFAGDGADVDNTGDLHADNVTRLGFVRFGTPPSRQILPQRVKWLELPRVRFAARIVENATFASGGAITVKVDRGVIDLWEKAKADQVEVGLLALTITPAGRQLPLIGVRAQIAQVYLDGRIVLTGVKPTPPPIQVFDAGSVILVQQRDNGLPLYVAEPAVLKHLYDHYLPLNEDLNKATATSVVNKDPDYPLSIKGFMPPCKPKRVIGVYEGADYQAGGHYRPAGACKMRASSVPAGGFLGLFPYMEGVDFCYVCKWLIVYRIDASLLGLLDHKHYPKAKKGG